jgi:hypothetical protein
MIARSVAEVLDQHVVLEVDGIDRLYLNAYVPLLQTANGVAHFFRRRCAARVVSPVLMAPMTRAFVAAIERFAEQHAIEVVHFRPGERKDDVTQARLRGWDGGEGVLYIGVAQERFAAFRMTKGRDRRTGRSWPQLFRSTVMCNQYYFYLVDAEFGPLFLKISSYFPYTIRVCLNGHEYAKRQLDKRGIAYEALDNGFLSCAEPKRLQAVLDGLDVRAIEALVAKWLARLPHPFDAHDQACGARYELSILQAEFALTQVFDRPHAGRQLFESIIRDNLDLGRPEHVSLIFDRRVTRTTPGRFATRVITDGVIPSLHFGYKRCKIKQYFKEGRALRTETTINDSRDFGVGRKIANLPALKQIGFAANRRLLQAERLAEDCLIGETTFQRLHQPSCVAGQRVPALRFGAPRTMALLQALALFLTLPDGFSNASLRGHVARLIGPLHTPYAAAQMTYDLRRLRLHGLIAPIARSHRYRVTDRGRHIALFLTKLHSRLLRPGLAQLTDRFPPSTSRPLHAAILRLDRAIDALIHRAQLSA